MKLRIGVIGAAAVAMCCFGRPAQAAEPVPPPGKGVPLFDGKTLSGWEGDPKIWRVSDGALTGGSYTETVRQNEFLATTRNYTNFIVRLQIKLDGSNGFINSGFQIRSQRVPKSSEMAGYQCDFGDPNWWGAIYDESRRNRVMAWSDMKALGPVIRRNDWNDYVIRADGPRITTWLNGVMGTDYTEADPAITESGRLGIQVHGGGKAVVQVRNITIEELPPTPPGRRFLGAPEPAKPATPSPRPPSAEKATFTLPPGFEIELVAAETDGIGKFVAVDFDQQGRMWSMTALEYPVDANEAPAVAQALYASRAKDKVVVYDRPFGPGPHEPRVFADGLAIPLGVLPWRDGVFVQHGTEIVFLNDTNRDGRADRRDVILSGFGVQDSHLFPHQFTRAPGNWMWMAQGAFNYSKVKTTTGRQQQFDQTRMARFRADGSDFDITSQGPCNIWGLAMNAEGETWIQEANDYGYPAMPFHPYANYPGCSDAQMKSYAPEFPGTAPDFRMGGTGLSGLALSDRAGWPEAYCNILYVANPITRRVQAIRIQRDGPRYTLQKLPDFLLSGDEWFRPVALRFGPDGCLYVVDWYNKIISHNEVPRNHPERDKIRGRIWRVKPTGPAPQTVPDFTTLDEETLLAKLGGVSTPQSHLAWQAITDRKLDQLTPRLNAIVKDASQPAGRRIAALWALEGLAGVRPAEKRIGLDVLRPMLADPNRNCRREAVRVLGEQPPGVTGDVAAWNARFDLLDEAARDVDPEVRAEVITTVGRWLPLFPLSSDTSTGPLLSSRALPLLVRLGNPSLDAPMGKSTQNGRLIRVGEAYEREFERYRVRMVLEQQPFGLEAFLGSPAATALPLENRLLASLALEPKSSARRVAALLPELKRPPGQEELLRLVQFPGEPGVSEALQAVFRNAALRDGALDALLKVRSRVNANQLSSMLTDAARPLLAGTEDAPAELGCRLAGAFQLASLEPDLARWLERGTKATPADPQSLTLTPAGTAALRALRDLRGGSPDQLINLARRASDPIVRNDAVAALVASRDPQATERLLKLWPDFTVTQRRTTLGGLASSKAGASTVVQGALSGSIDPADLDAATIDRLQVVLGNDPSLGQLLDRLSGAVRPVLRLDGTKAAQIDSNVRLAGPFTVEAWLKLDPTINNQDGILGATDQLDINFFDSQLRVWVAGVHDVVLARRKAVPGVWTHYAVTRDAAGIFRIYINGELDATGTVSVKRDFEGLDIARTIPPAGGTGGWMTEVRVWSVTRTAAEIRADFDRSYEGGTRPAGLAHYYPGAGPWPQSGKGARMVRTTDFPSLLTATEAAELAAKFEKYQRLGETGGDLAHGRLLFGTLCQNCHAVGGQGGQVGPVLNGAGALGLEALLRNVLTPNAAMEPGYRIFRVELRDGDVIDGILVRNDAEAMVVRRPNTEDLRIPVKDVRRADYTRRSMMPEGLLEALPEQDVRDLLTYLKTLK